MTRPLLLAATLALTSLSALAQTTTPPAPTPASAPIVVSGAWARASAGASNTGAAYVTLTDTGAPDRLVGASTPVAGMAMLHESIDDNGVMRMRDVAGIALAPGKTVTFAPGGYHLMLMGLTSPLKQGETFPLTLTFEHASPVTVQVTVAGVGATAPAGDNPAMRMPMSSPAMTGHTQTGMTPPATAKP